MNYSLKHLPVFLPFFEGVEVYSNSKQVDQNWVEADMILGNPRQRCRGVGICKIGLSGVSHTCGCTPIPIRMNRVGQFCLQLIVDRNFLTQEQCRNHFKNNEVEISQPIKLSLEICRKLGVNKPLIITPKKYTVHYDQNYLHHFLDCRPVVVEVAFSRLESGRIHSQKNY